MKNLLFIVLGFLGFLWVPFDAIDSYRYYEYTNTISIDVTLGQFVLLNFVQTFDFVYYLLFFFCLKLNIPVQLVTGISIGLLFQQTFKCLDLACINYNIRIKKTDQLLIRAFIIFSVSFITLFGISRFVTGMVFFTYGINKLLNKQKMLALLFFCLAVFTHIGLLIYLILCFLGFKWNPQILNRQTTIRRVILLFIIIVGLFSFLWISPVLKIFSLFWIIQSGYDYTKYFDIASTSNIFGFDFGFGDLIMFYTLFVTFTYTLFNIRKYNRFIWVFFIIYSWLVISMGFSQMWAQRTILFLIPLQGIIISFFFMDQVNTQKAIICKGLLLIAILSFFVNVYSYRGVWIFKWPIVN